MSESSQLGFTSFGAIDAVRALGAWLGQPPARIAPGFWQLLQEQKWAALWSELGGGGRGAVLAIGGACLIGLLWLSILGIRKLGERGRRLLLWGLTVASGTSSAILIYQAHRLANEYFRFEDQVARGGAVLALIVFVICVLALATPRVLDVVERLGFVGFVSVRQIRAGKSGVLTVISILSIGGVFLSSLAMCVVVSIMGGFGADLRNKILDNNAHITIDTPKVGGLTFWQEIVEEVRLTPSVQAATPIATGEAMASSRSNTAGALLRGIDPDTFGSVIKVIDKIEVGRFEYLMEPEKLLALPVDEVVWIGKNGSKHLAGPPIEPRSLRGLDPETASAVKRDDAYPGIILGKELAKSLHVQVGDEMTLVAPLGELGPAGPMPRTQRFRVAAVFNTRMYEYDSTQAYVLLENAQAFLDLKSRVTSVEVRVDDPTDVEAVTETIAAKLGAMELPAEEPRVRNWQELNRNLFSALQLEKIVTYIILAIAIVVASFCIVCTLLLMVTEKRKEIAILKSLGASDNDVLKTFLSEGLIIGAVGTLFGVVTAAIACVALKQLGVGLDPEIWYVERLPVEVNPLEYVFIAVCSLAITMLATVYPAVAASRLRPVDGIRYE